MQVYGPALLHKLVATKEDLNALIRCLDAMPNLSDVVDGATVILSKTQKGYSALHTYRAEITEESSRWVDITDGYGPIERHDSERELHCEYETDSDNGELFCTGYLKCWWDPPAATPESGDLQYSIVTRKQGAYPENMSDGEVLFSSPAGESYDDEIPYRYDDKACGSDLSYCYRIFHIFASGWWSYSDGPQLQS